ncbi:MAG: 2-keto-4-pentenoate hydratase/2-oxohepta-3-ene-1,7-dioic acid hydratase in catechol pathway [Gammaproteobacteria bacterium]
MQHLKYRHQLSSTLSCSDELGKIVCVGRNYADHAKELNNPIPKRPLLFIKPATAAVSMLEPMTIPKNLGACHHEVEMAILIGSEISASSSVWADDDIRAAIAGVGLALDLTLREVQDVLKEKGQPWERAKAFDGSCPLSNFVSAEGIDLQNLSLQLHRNGQLQQSGNTVDMLFSVTTLLRDISASFTLLPGDVVLTGTPAGVGPLSSGDTIKATLGTLVCVESSVN